MNSQLHFEAPLCTHACMHTHARAGTHTHTCTLTPSLAHKHTHPQAPSVFPSLTHTSTYLPYTHACMYVCAHMHRHAISGISHSYVIILLSPLQGRKTEGFWRKDCLHVGGKTEVRGWETRISGQGMCNISLLSHYLLNQSIIIFVMEISCNWSCSGGTPLQPIVHSFLINPPLITLSISLLSSNFSI